eukprot:GHVR01003640.1.p1 GENE.GHVR01003640.1~~GHVR01003640.1.p1  ORF type:complete len:183 (+),score=7.53 GHVR01003640.1:567-1115(+)
MTKLLISLLLAVLQQSAAPTACMQPAEMTGFTGERAFTQTRKFEGIDQSMVSTGTALIEGEVIVWTVTDPISIAMTITDTSITQSIEGGPDEPVGSTASISPLLSQSGMFDLIKGDLDADSIQYDIEITDETDDGWTVALTPKSTKLAEIVSSIEISGCQALDHLTLRQASGDTVTVAFSGD